MCTAWQLTYSMHTTLNLTYTCKQLGKLSHLLYVCTQLRLYMQATLTKWFILQYCGDMYWRLLEANQKYMEVTRSKAVQKKKLYPAGIAFLLPAMYTRKYTGQIQSCYWTSTPGILPLKQSIQQVSARYNMIDTALLPPLYIGGIKPKIPHRKCSGCICVSISISTLSLDTKNRTIDIGGCQLTWVFI